MFARLLGAHGAGVVLQAIGAFTIALSVAKFGLDTTAVWLLPRMIVHQDPALRSAVVGMLTAAFLGGLVLLLLWQSARMLMEEQGTVEEATTLALLFLPAASVMVVALSVTRAFGGVLAYNLVDNVGVPLLRPILLVVVVALGGGAVAASVGWALSWLLGAVAVLAVVWAQVGATSLGDATRWVPSRGTWRRIFGYSVPRTFMSVLEQSLIWLNVLLVGMVLGAADAGVYGSAARFVNAGVIVFTALRIVVAPRFSALLADGEHGALQELYSVTGRWILLFGTPIYLVLAVFAPTALAWLGPEFAEGRATMVVLCLGSCVLLMAGNVQPLLLMSGRVGWGLAAKALVVLVNVCLTMALLHPFGIVGAAVGWVVAMVLDNVLATFLVWRAVGIGPEPLVILRLLVIVLLCVGVPCIVAERLLGQGLLPLMTGVVIGMTALLAYAALDRRRLHLQELRLLQPRR